MPFQVEFRPSVLKSLGKIPKKDLLRIKKAIEQLAADPPPPSRTKLKGNNPFHRIRCGAYRIIYEINGEQLVILVVRIGHRRDVYSRLS